MVGTRTSKSGLLRGLLPGSAPADSGLQFLLVRLEPINLRVRIERAGASPPEHLGVVDARWHGAVVGQRPRRGQQPPPRPRDHDIAWGKVLLRVIHDRPHAFRNGLILYNDVANAGVDLVRALGLAINLPVVADILHRPPASVPIRGVGKIFEGIGSGY